MEKLFSVLKDKGHVFLLGTFAIILVLFGVIGWLITHDDSPEAAVDEDIYSELLLEDVKNDESEEEAAEPLQEMTPQLTEVMVDVKGAVHHPGVYTLGSGKRIIDAINQAGGLLEAAESKAVNFAQILEDQMVIYVPEIGEEINTELAASVPQSQKENTDGASAKIDINTADQTALMTLNGIGNSKAENIINYRQENGPFKTIEDLKNVSGIGDATFNNLKDHVYVSP